MIDLQADPQVAARMSRISFLNCRWANVFLNIRHKLNPNIRLSDICAKRHLCEQHLREVDQKEKERERKKDVSIGNLS